jgi:hypothetical protein
VTTLLKTINELAKSSSLKRFTAGGVPDCFIVARPVQAEGAEL